MEKKLRENSPEFYQSSRDNDQNFLLHCSRQEITHKMGNPIKIKESI